MQKIQKRVYLLTFITIIPFLLYTGFIHYQKIQDEKSDILNHLTEITNLTAAENKQITEGARQLLIAIASNPSVSSKKMDVCNSFLANLKNNYVRYVNFGVVDKSGRLICAADVELAMRNPINSNLINQTLTHSEFSVGTYYPINSLGSVINFTYPIDKSSLAYASLSLDWVSDFAATLHVSSNDFVINILDKNGTVLARNPETKNAIGQNFATDPLVKEILTQGSGQSTKVGIDQVLRLYAFTALNDSHSAYIAVGIPQSQIYDSTRQSLINSLMVILSISVISLFLANQSGRYLVVKQLESLEEIDKLKDEFVSLASHQIRSPLTAIRWLSEALVEDKTLTHKQSATVNKIHSTTLRLITLTSSLLSISRLETGSLVTKSKNIVLKEIIQSIIHEHTPQQTRANVYIKPHIPKSIRLYSDPFLITEILRVLLDNAIKYSEVTSTILIKAIVKSPYTRITFTNTGIGIPDSAKNHIFTRFYRADNARMLHPDGNGVGLYLANLIATKLGGTLTFISTKNQTIFTLTLPNEVR